ncbi:MAG: hypothetical protein HYS62_02955 [Candidatus Aenigmarchaeota archaeon]|nr:hypothetical protein [Candidatus Aenigmarchaeota archaeon]
MNKNLVIAGLAAVIVVLVVTFLFANGIVKLPASSKYKSSDEVSGATVGIGSGVERVGSTLEEIDSTLG